MFRLVLGLPTIPHEARPVSTCTDSRPDRQGRVDSSGRNSHDISLGDKFRKRVSRTTPLTPRTSASVRATRWGASRAGAGAGGLAFWSCRPWLLVFSIPGRRTMALPRDRDGGEVGDGGGGGGARGGRRAGRGTEQVQPASEGGWHPCRRKRTEEAKPPSASGPHDHPPPLSRKGTLRPRVSLRRSQPTPRRLLERPEAKRNLSRGSQIQIRLFKFYLAMIYESARGRKPLFSLRVQRERRPETAVWPIPGEPGSARFGLALMVSPTL